MLFQLVISQLAFYPSETIMDVPPPHPTSPTPCKFIRKTLYSKCSTFNSEKLNAIEVSDGSEVVKYIMIGYLQPWKVMFMRNI